MTEQFNPVLEDISINNKNPVLADMSSNEPSLWKDVVVKTGKDIVKSLAPIEGLVSWPGAPYRVIKKTLEGGSTLSAVGEEISKPVSSALEIIQPAANIAYTPAVITQEAVKNMVRKARGKELTSETGLGDVGKLFKGEERTGIVEDIRGKKFESPFVQGLVEGAESFTDPLLGFGTISQIIAKNIPANFSKFVSKEMAADLEKITAHEKAVGSRLSSLEKAARERGVKEKLAFFEGITKAETANKSPLYDIPTEPEVFGKPEKIPYSVRAARAKKAGVSIEDIPKFEDAKPIGQKLYGSKYQGVGRQLGETKLYSGMPIDFEKFIELADKAGKKVDDYLSGIGVSPESISIIMSNLGRTAKEVAKREERGGLKPLGAMEAKRLGGEGLAAKPITSESILDKPPIESSMDTRNFVKESVEAEKKAVTEADAFSVKKSRIREVEKRAISSAGRVLERETPAGKEMVGLVNKTYKAGERLGGKFAADSKLNTKGLSKAEKENLVEVLEGGKPINDKVAQVAIKERDLYNQVAKLAGETDMTVLHPTVRKWTITGERGAWSLNDERGNVLQTFSRKADAEATLNSYLNTPFHIRENYFPRMVKRDVLEKRINEAIEHLIDTGQIEKADRATGALLSRDAQRELARSKINIYMRRNSERRYGNLQISRELDLPKWAYETNYDIVAPTYFEKAGMRIAQAEAWGAKDEKLRDLAQLIQEQGGDSQQATRLLDRILHKEVFDEGADTILAAVTGYNVKTKMGLSQIAQVGQRLSALYRTNAGSFYKAIKSIHQNPEAEADYFLRIGAGLRGVSQAARQQMAGSTTTEGFLKYTGFTRQDLKSRLIAGVTGRFYAEHLVDKLVKTKAGSFGNNFARRRLEQLDLKPDEIMARGGKLTEEERIIAGQKAEIDTNFRNSILDLPEFWTSRWGKVITQFKSFSYAQTKMLRDYVVKEAMHGNPLPMVSLLTAGQVSGEVINDVRSLITGKDRPKNIPQRVLENYAIAGTTGVFEMMFSTIKYADSQFGATLTTIKEGVKAGASAIKGEFKEAAEFAAEQIPVAGQRARREVQKLMESEATKKKKEREDKYWEKHPWSPRGVFPGTPPKKSESSGGYSAYGGY